MLYTKVVRYLVLKDSTHYDAVVIAGFMIKSFIL